MLEKDMRRAERKKRRMDERRQILERGGELTDPDEEIDGLSSVSSIASEAGFVIDSIKEEEFENNQRRLIKEKEELQRNVRAHPALLKAIKERWGNKFDMTKQQILEELAKVDTE